jgi:serine/threonine protein kinase
VSEDLTGRRLGHYRIDGVIGRGGMSVMYRATDMRLGRKVALKVIGDQLAADPEFRERFVDEARNTSAIDHAHVVPLYDFDEVNGQLYIAMRYVEGSDLASLIKDGPLSSQRTLTLLGQVAEALDALHGRGLVHLDVKPANVLVTPKENIGGEHVYLADFGLTRRGATGHRTRSGDFLGSPTYAAPEHLRGEPVDARTDQYSLTCVLFTCLTGRPPFPGKVPEVIAGHLGSEPPALTPLVLLPAGIDDVVRRGMSKDPARRYGNCRELLAAARLALTAPVEPRIQPPAAGVPGGPGSNPGVTGTAPSPPVQHPPMQGSPLQGSPAQAPPGPRPVVPPTGWSPSRPATQFGPYNQPRYQADQAPMRIRDPLPAQSASFARAGGGAAGWLVPILLGIAAVGLVILMLIIALSDGGSENSPPTSPSIGSTTSRDQLPTDIPTVTR